MKTSKIFQVTSQKKIIFMTVFLLFLFKIIIREKLKSIFTISDYYIRKIIIFIIFNNSRLIF